MFRHQAFILTILAVAASLPLSIAPHGAMTPPASDCVINGCRLDLAPPTYSPAVNNCGQFVVEGALVGTDGSCQCPWESGEPGEECTELSPDCAASISYTITPADKTFRICEWANYPTTPATWNSSPYGQAATVTLRVAGCGDKDEARAFIAGRPSSGPEECHPNMFTTCIMTFKLACNSCDKGC